MNRRDFLVNSALLGAGVGVLGAPSVLDALTTTILSIKLWKIKRH